MALLLGAGRQDTSASGRSAYKLCVYRRARSYSSRSISRFMTLSSLPDDLQRPAGRSGRRHVALRLWPHGMGTTGGARVTRSSGAVPLGALTLCIDHDTLTRAAAYSAPYLEGTTGRPGARASGGSASSQCGMSTQAEDSRRRITSTPTRLKAMDSSRTSPNEPVA